MTNTHPVYVRGLGATPYYINRVLKSGFYVLRKTDWEISCAAQYRRTVLFRREDLSETVWYYDRQSHSTE